MSLTTEFEGSFSARLNFGLQVLDNRLSETLDTSVSTCRGHWPGADHFTGQNVAALFLYRTGSPFLHERN